VLAGSDRLAGLVTQPPSPSRELLATYYRAGLIEYQCLVDHGFRPSEPPSEDVYIESGGLWDPFADLGAQESFAAEQVCTRSMAMLFEQMAAAGQTP